MSKQQVKKFKHGINLSDPSTFQVDGLSGFNSKPIVFAVGNQDGLLVRVIHRPVKPTVLEDNNWVMSTYDELQYMRTEGRDDPLAGLKRRARKHIASLILCKRFPKLIRVRDNTFVLIDGSKMTDVLNEARSTSEAKWKAELPVHQRRKFEAAPPKRPKMPEVGLLASVPEKYRNLYARYLFLLETPEIKDLLGLIPNWDIKAEAVKNPFEQTVQKPIGWATGMTEAQVRGSIARIISDGSCAGKIRETRKVSSSSPAPSQEKRSTSQKTDKVEGNIRGLLSKFDIDGKDELPTAIDSYPMPSAQDVTFWKDDKLEKSRNLREDYVTEYHRFQDKLKASALARDKYRSSSLT
jgi:hypothetical protein